MTRPCHQMGPKPPRARRISAQIGGKSDLTERRWDMTVYLVIAGFAAFGIWYLHGASASE